ncbi:hypothetical protein B9Z55_011502 [Caenorhabditis nigoni]|uniref:C3H1-type domain-containing protein n=1 Tax=Caenorhabditis nigoni TaxID=1611254 RepID=A0A2G5UKA6_9PELO|nr:hypothetical protein B9Z55_011502 [Caenorhabditis nigoni]
MNYSTEIIQNFENFGTFGQIHKPNYKTQLCKNWSRLGCGHCGYGPRCQFIHPEDHGYLEVYPDTWHFAKEQEAHSQYVQALHAQKLVNPFYEALIDRKVREWNAQHPKGPNYYDFDGLTTKLADFYILDIILYMKSAKIQKSWIETGRGNHSKANFAAIRTNFLTNQFPPGVSFVPVPGNDGILCLTVV